MDDLKDTCLTCGEQSNYDGSARCTPCREVESRLKRYLESEGGRRHVRKLLDDYLERALTAREAKDTLAVSMLAAISSNLIFMRFSP